MKFEALAAASPFVAFVPALAATTNLGAHTPAELLNGQAVGAGTMIDVMFSLT